MHPLSSSETECVCVASSLPSLASSSMPMMTMMSVMSVMPSSPEETLLHQLFNVNPSETSSSRKASSKSTESSASKTTIPLRIVFSSHVVDIFPLRILEKFIGIDNFLELFLGPGVLFVAIRMVLLGSFFESFPDLILISLSRNSKNLVWVRSFSFELRYETYESYYSQQQNSHSF